MRRVCGWGGGDKDACRILVGKPRGRQKRRKEGDIKMDLTEMCCEEGRWMELAQDRVQW
jgi:hypothetical protein